MSGKSVDAIFASVHSVRDHERDATFHLKLHQGAYFCSKYTSSPYGHFLTPGMF